jgi:microcystin-dependent protein
MSDPFVAEIRIFGFNFAPTGWAQCNGQLLPISQNTALFSLLGTVYGGDGKSTFGLPNLQGSAAIHQGQGQGLSDYAIGQTGGSSAITLLPTEMPFHNHTMMAATDPSNAQIPTPAVSLSRSAGGNAYNPSTSGLQPLAAQATSIAGGGLPHNNMMPFLTLNVCIAMQGIFPARP